MHVIFGWFLNWSLQFFLFAESAFIAEDVVLRSAMHEHHGDFGKHCCFDTKSKLGDALVSVLFNFSYAEIAI